LPGFRHAANIFFQSGHLALLPGRFKLAAALGDLIAYESGLRRIGSY
jgi:hypothetical protein